MKILCCGDSHTKVFEYCNKKQNEFVFDVCIVGGATAQGSVNPNSRTDALRIFRNKIMNTHADKILIMLGEVDCGFIIWVRSTKYNISVDEQINNCVKNLFAFINNILETTNYKKEQIIVAGSILPTIRDSTDKKYLNGARSEVDVSQLERTTKTIEYNNKLKTKCAQYGFNYIDITDDIINDEGIVKSCFLSKNPYDHHLNDEITYDLWLSKIKKLKI